MKKSVFIFCINIVLLSSCFNKAKQEVYEGELQELNLGAMSSMDYVPFLIAQKEGIYDSLGLKVNFIKFFSANDRDAAFQSGNIDGTVIDFTGAALQQANGIDLNIVMKNDGFFYFIAGKSRGVESLYQLKGKNIAVSRNTVIEFSTDKALESVGILPTEVNKPEINKIPLRLEMLQNGLIDASIFPDPFATIAINNGNKSIITTKELGISVTGTIFTGKAIAEKPHEIRALIQGYNMAIDYLKTHELIEWESVLIEGIGIEKSLVNKITLPNFQKASLPAKEDITSTIEWLKAKQLIPETYKGEKLIDNSFIKSIK